MSPQEWLQVEELLETALKLEPEQRRIFLHSHVADKALCGELESLLAHDQGAASFLEVPAIEIAAGSSESGESGVASGPVEPGMQVGPYEVVAYLGCGGMGHVYRAKDTRLGRDVALKFLSAKTAAGVHALERFKREARAVSALNHPNICTLHDIGDYAGQPFLVMELLDGQSLKDRLADGPLSPPQVVNFGIQIAQALEALHAVGIVHRDVKPANVFITPRGRAKLLDLGLAKVLNAPVPADQTLPTSETTAPVDVTITSFGAAMGTAAFMAPEQVRGEEIDARADLFSLGVTLYQMATGRLPFVGSSIEFVLDSIVHRNPVKPRALNLRISRELEAIILKALQKEKAARYPSAAELRADLERFERPQASHHTAGLIAAAMLVLAIGFAFIGAKFRWFGDLSPAPEMIARQITANPPEDPVTRAHVSPDGAYIAYTDLRGIHVRRIASGETRLIAPPKDFCFR